MPIYEYRCRQCGTRTTRLVLSVSAMSQQTCAHCHSADLERLLSRFASPKSEEARLEALSDPSHLSGLDENDPASMERFMKKMGQELGEDLGEDLDASMGGDTSSPTDMDMTE
ncbi:MAG TPA: zinc ribbon domain-containing protein [Nitrospira sp.]|nr:zinc ribbon domain-containing protein [Nitrospira sp.]MCC7472988.1 zinc ribbon domain-containing protein [Candidatus Nomurabacteria bacterium]MBS0157491.1 zinc ribbon domain-containing protein [Nitrospira sp.]MBS0164065.1 zinc ribbon domain-containing protein [Nitrospira sp.]MBS0174722.1 zinc ribbon domain-containing protein [Nitrospira sp.]